MRIWRDPYTSQPSTSTLPPIPHDHQNAPTASVEKAADERMRIIARMPLIATLIVNGDVRMSRMIRIGYVILQCQHCTAVVKKQGRTAGSKCPRRGGRNQQSPSWVVAMWSAANAAPEHRRDGGPCVLLLTCEVERGCDRES